MTDSVCRQFDQAQLGQQLLDENDKTDCRNKSAQEGLRQHAVQETQAKQSRQENGSASRARDDTAYLSMHDSIVVSATALIHTPLDDTADQQRPGGLGAEDHLRGAAEQSVAERVEDEGVQAVHGRNVSQGVGEGQGHGKVHSGDGQCCYEVAFKER